MAVKFRGKKGYRSAMHRMRHPFLNINTFETAVRSLIVDNPLGCCSYRSVRKHHKHVEKVREMYTAKFVYEDAKGKRVGTGSETYNSVKGYRTGIAAVISNMANVASHGGSPRHTTEADLFAVTLRCNDPEHGLYFLNLARNRITVSSYGDAAILARAGRWIDTIQALA
jgi:hypothetical protein